MSHRPRSSRLLSFAATMLFLAGCQHIAPSRIQVVDFREGQEQQAFQENFPEAYYALDAAGQLEVVLRRETTGAADPTQPITQIIHIKGIYRWIPGKSSTESTGINARIAYMIMVGEAGATFEGVGTMLYRDLRYSDDIKGKIEHALLKPTRQRRGGAEVFEHAEVVGRFRAKHDPQRLRRLVHEANRLFGPLPPPTPPPAGG